MSNQSVVLLVFLRQFACIFCRQAIRDIAERNKAFLENNVKPIFVHMVPTEQAEIYFSEYEVENYQHISDPDCKLYKEFGLTKGTFSQLYGLQTWVKGYKATTEGIPFKLKTVGDSLQMPGIFILCNGKIEDSYIHKNVSDRPDYDKLIKCCTN